MIPTFRLHKEKHLELRLAPEAMIPANGMAYAAQSLTPEHMIAGIKRQLKPPLLYRLPARLLQILGSLSVG